MQCPGLESWHEVIYLPKLKPLPRPPKVARKPVKGYYSTYFWGPGKLLTEAPSYSGHGGTIPRGHGLPF